MLFGVIFVFCFVPGLVGAQKAQEDLTLALDRNFGYGGFGKIQGRFTLKAKGPADLERVVFFIDGEEMGEVLQAPYHLSFHTGDYQPGEHVFSATGWTGGGETLESNRVAVTILSADQAWKETSRILIPLMVIVGVVTLIGVGAPFLLGRKKEFQVGQYGPAGGAVCPRCELPYSRHVLAPNLLVGKLEKCPHCGKWSIVPAAPDSALEKAEGRYRADQTQIDVEKDSEEAYRKLLEESRYQE